MISGNDTDTYDDYMMKEVLSGDIDIGGEDKILHSVKMYGIFCVHLSDLIRIYPSHHTYKRDMRG
jgi:hypothetical protein